MILQPLKLMKSVLWFKQYRKNVYKKKLNAAKTVDFLSNIWLHLPRVSVMSIR